MRKPIITLLLGTFFCTSLPSPGFSQDHLRAFSSLETETLQPHEQATPSFLKDIKGSLIPKSKAYAKGLVCGLWRHSGKIAIGSFLVQGIFFAPIIYKIGKQSYKETCSALENHQQSIQEDKTQFEVSIEIGKKNTGLIAEEFRQRQQENWLANASVLIFNVSASCFITKIAISLLRKKVASLDKLAKWVEYQMA